MVFSTQVGDIIRVTGAQRVAWYVDGCDGWYVRLVQLMSDGHCGWKPCEPSGWRMMFKPWLWAGWERVQRTHEQALAS